MRHFDEQQIATRYAKYRPQIHHEVLHAITARQHPPRRYHRALDVACGTGHSTAALRSLAHQVVGCDVSNAMLEQAARAYPDIEFHTAPAEALPLADGTVDLLTVGFAFHWFDQPAFLREAARVLRPGGHLVLYNLVFPGVMLGNDAYQDWHQNTYQARYPNPQRHRRPLGELLTEGEHPLVTTDEVDLDLHLDLTPLALRNYLTTQSNIAVALENGEELERIDAWLDDALRPYFADPTERFRYHGRASVLTRT